MMIIPVRCVSCGKTLGDKWETFKEKVSKGQKPAKVLDELGVKRYCCRSVMITHVDLLNNVSNYKINVEEDK